MESNSSVTICRLQREREREKERKRANHGPTAVVGKGKSTLWDRPRLIRSVTRRGVSCEAANVGTKLRERALVDALDSIQWLIGLRITDGDGDDGDGQCSHALASRLDPTQGSSNSGQETSAAYNKQHVA